ncbi:MAG: phosphoenolpyruvate--protein phosphotransferase [Deltaproteobacteria bacterium]|nr:phosphoenolpyruvate--protein phosphotransferase [Deltaproteobacteria bacterium]
MARKILTQTAASPGIAIGRVHLLAGLAPTIPHYWIPHATTAKEILRFQRAVTHAQDDLTRIRDRLCRFQSRDQRQILEMHLLLLQDEMLVQHTIDLIRDRAIGAEWALEKTLDYINAAMLGATEAYLRERRADVEQVGLRILRHLLGIADRTIKTVPYPATILIAADLSPAEVASLNRAHIKGLATARGGRTSHTAIIARSLEIPAILGLDAVVPLAREGELAILDADRGRLLLQPTRTEIAQYQRRQRRTTHGKRLYRRERDLPAETRDGVRVGLAANIEVADEIAHALTQGAESIGLFRSEYLFLNRADSPSEEEQLAQYRLALEQAAPRPVTIRTLDIGGDKIAAFTEYAVEANPALGLRGIRFCLRERALFMTQLRALYRASIYGPLRILVPMISDLEEWRAVTAIIAEVQQALTTARIPFDDRVPLGIMVEVPATVMLIDDFVRQVQFLSIGTNDLTQYALAADRGNEHVSYLYRAIHPAMLRMIHRIVTAARRYAIPVTLCGEMAADPMAVPFLVGLEVATLSMMPVSLPPVKHLIRSLSLVEQKAAVARALQAGTVAEVEAILRTVREPKLLTMGDEAPKTA